MKEVCIGVLPVLIGFILDCILGDPYWLPHPVRLIGRLISSLEGLLYRPEYAAGSVETASDQENFKQGHNGEPSNRNLQKARCFGMLLVILVLIISTGIPALLLYVAYHIHVCVGILLESIFCYYLLAAKCLKDESMKVYRALVPETDDSLQRARQAVSMIVGRDTEQLDRAGVIKATVETVAENTSDGVTAPLFYMAFGGAVLGFFYKAANTMDSMLGYQNDKYMYFGTFAAKLDDVLNYIPSRLTAWMMIISAWILKMDGANAYRIWKRDRRKHKSPNSAQTEACCAGALNVRLAGDAYYFGKLCKKDSIGDDIRPVETADIPKANRLMYGTTVIMLVFALLVRGVVFSAII